MVTDDNRLVLIEINTNPALSLDNSTLEKLLPVVVDDTIDIVLKCQGPDKVTDATTGTATREGDTSAATATSTTATATATTNESSTCTSTKTWNHVLGWTHDNLESKFELLFDEETNFIYGN